MACLKSHTLLPALVDGELVGAERSAYEQHLDECPTCQGEAERTRRLKGLVKSSLTHEGGAPEALRLKLKHELGKASARRRRRRLGQLTFAAASVALVCSTGYWQYRLLQRKLYEEDAALRHARQLPLEVQQPSVEQLEAWFGGKLDHRVAVPALGNAMPAGGRLLNVRDKPAAYIRYEAPRPNRPPSRVGLFVFGDRGEVAVAEEPAVSNSHGFNVVSWRRGDIVYQLVTDLDEPELLQLVPRASEPSLPRPVSRPVEAQPASLSGPTFR